jgi:hypothetical protein
MSEQLPAIPCECGHVGEPDVEVRRLSPTTDEYRYVCSACRALIVTLVLGDADEVDARGRALGGFSVSVDLGGRET